MLWDLIDDAMSWLKTILTWLFYAFGGLMALCFFIIFVAQVSISSSMHDQLPYFIATNHDHGHHLSRIAQTIRPIQNMSLMSDDNTIYKAYVLFVPLRIAALTSHHSFLNLAYVSREIGQTSFANGLTDLGDLYMGEEGLKRDLHELKDFRPIADHFKRRGEYVSLCS